MASGNGNRTNAMDQNAANVTTASGASSLLNPIYASMATSPSGYTPQQKADLLTAAGQGAGGGTASAVGQAGLMAARTGNAGGGDAAIDAAAQAAGRTQANAGLQVGQQDAQLMQQNRDTGLAGLNDIYHTATGAAVSDLNAANGAGPSLWKQLFLQGVQGAGQVGAAYAGNQ